MIHMNYQCIISSSEFKGLQLPMMLFVLLNLDLSESVKNVDPDQLASGEAI